ncbi:NACHT domain-containing protein [Pseudoalteromonas sp. 2CM39R]|uniref:NACHT domain-containing protein n=1 Tax=Pseudoalteromonas sp. 2CM39R TaxID=2929856 RepID=UPI0020C0D918|nr:NACHT domain-containing protein [Pseudoalteromonas sp. 2CM39R]MCK8124216.1 NACHT domain-containing protein [Pseudoalteromonas sp. 2CM39R]
MGILEGIAIKGLTSLTTNLVKKFVDLGWNKVAEEFSASFNEEDLIAFCKACDEYINIRTLYSRQQDVFIDDVYVPLFMSPINELEKQYEISNLSFYSEGITNIIGRAGQGKSTFLRKMLINELKSGNTIPIFFELKYLSTEFDFLQQLSTWFERHNLKISEKGVARLLKNGYIKVFLDGFDEIHPAAHDEALALIKDLSRAYPKITIIVTTRPDTLITTEPFISNYNVLELTKDNVRNLFLNISNNNVDLTDDAIEQIQKYPSIEEITKTPILAILLFITYRAWSKIPDNLADFYKKIFITLLTHHDSLKPGKKIDRGIDIPLNDHQIEDVFSVFCFTTFSENMDTFTNREASAYMKEAISSECYEGICSKNLVNVIKQCTGILCSDGYDLLAFSHKSLQEYYAAVYIKKQSIHDIRNFYKSVKFAEQERKYGAVLSFLSAEDFDNYAKYYYIPCFKEMFNVETVKAEIDGHTMHNGIEKVIQSVAIPFRAPNSVKASKSVDEKNKIEKKSISIGLRIEFNDNESTYFHMKLLQPIIFNLISSGVYFEFLTSNLEKISDYNKDEDDELDFPLQEVLEGVTKENKDKFFTGIYKDFTESITVIHGEIIKKYKKRSQPSLLNKVFKKSQKEDSKIITG